MPKDDRSLTRADVSGKQSEELFFKAYKKSFFSAVKWNVFESLSYQLIFVAHQIGLFTYCDRMLYGKVGVLFAFSYLMITVLIAGLDGGLLPFFKNFIADKKSFSFLITHYIKRQIFFIIAAAACGTACMIALSPFHSFTSVTIILVGFFIIMEGIKKLLKHLLYLAFYNRYTAFIEIIQILLYVGSIWTLYFCGFAFSIPLFLIPFILFSFFSNLACCALLFNYYQTLPDTHSVNLFFLQSAFISARVFVLINQLCRSLFTSNFLVPLFSLYGGFAQAGVITFANYLTHACTFFMYKVCVPPAEALLSRVKNLSLSTHYKALKNILSLFIAITFILGILVFFKGQSFATLIGYTSITHLTWNLFLFFFFIHLLENVFILYEKFFLLQERAGILALGNIISCCVCIGITRFSFSFFSTVLICIFIRFLFFFMLSCIIALSKPAPDGALQRSFRRWPLLNVFYFGNPKH